MKCKTRHLMLLGCLLFSSKQALAVNVIYTLDSGIGYSDNARQTDISTDPVKDSARFVGGSLNIVDESSTNDFSLAMDVAYVDYRDDTFDDETIGNMSLASNFSIIDDSLTWILDGFYGQQAINAFSVTTPDSLQNTAFVSTGPDLAFRFTNIDSLTLGYRYRYFYAELSPADYKSNIFRAVFARRLSPLHSISFNIENEDLNYDDQAIAASDFESLQYTVALTGTTRSTQYGIEFGVIDVKFDTGASGDNDVYRLFLNRDMNSFNTVSFQFSKTVDNGARAVTGTTPGVVTTGLFINDAAQFAYSYSRGSLSFNFNSTYSELDFVEPGTADRKDFNNSIALVYGAPINLQSTIEYSRLKRDFLEQQGVVTIEDTITFRMVKQIFTNINIIGTYRNFSREARSNVAPTQDTKENRVLLTIQYLGRI